MENYLCSSQSIKPGLLAPEAGLLPTWPGLIWRGGVGCGVTFPHAYCPCQVPAPTPPRAPVGFTWRRL